MEKMGWTLYTLELLRQIPGLELTVLDSQCCGIAGTYGFKKENYPTSQSIGAPLFRQIEESGADIVVTDCETCKWQIEMSTSKRCEHPSPCLPKRWVKPVARWYLLPGIFLRSPFRLIEYVAVEHIYL